MGPPSWNENHYECVHDTALPRIRGKSGKGNAGAYFAYALPFFLASGPFFFDLVLTRMGVPLKPNLRRNWLARYRSCEKCSGPPLSVNIAKAGGRMECWVM